MLLRVELAPSRFLFAGVAISYLLALASLKFSDIPAWASCALAIGIFSSAQLGQAWRKPPVALLISDEIIRLYFSDHQINVLLETECHCTPWVQVLHFRECLQDPGLKSSNLTSPALTEPDSQPALRPRCGAARFSVILLPDSCSKNMRRRLAVLLRWHRFARESQLL